MRRVIDLLALGSAGALVVSVLISPDALPPVRACLFDLITGLPCAGCGLVRGFCALSHGELARAWELHPFSIPLYLIAVGLAASPFTVRRFPGGFARLLQSPWLVWGSVALALALVVFGLWRMRAETEAIAGIQRTTQDWSTSREGG